jgi:hypothetical protein
LDPQGLEMADDGLFVALNFFRLQQGLSCSTKKLIELNVNTVKPVYNDHPWDLKNVVVKLVMQRVSHF